MSPQWTAASPPKLEPPNGLFKCPICGKYFPWNEIGQHKAEHEEKK